MKELLKRYGGIPANWKVWLSGGETIMRFLLLITILMALSGCVSRVHLSRLEAEQGANYYDPQLSTKEILDHGLQVANGYLPLADRVATAQDGVSVFNIILASGAALAVINDAGTDSIARVGVAGLAVNQTTTYFDPETAKNSLTKAARRQFCIVGVGQAMATNDPFDKKIVADALTRVKIFLREDLNRQPNNYSEIFEAQSTAQQQALIQSRSAVVVLQTELNKCVALG